MLGRSFLTCLDAIRHLIVFQVSRQAQKGTSDWLLRENSENLTSGACASAQFEPTKLKKGPESRHFALKQRTFLWSGDCLAVDAVCCEPVSGGNSR